MGGKRLKGLLIIIITSIITGCVLVSRTWAGPAIVDEPIFTDVTPAAFSIVWTVDEPATCTAQVYRDAQGLSQVTCIVESQSPAQAEDLGVMKVLVYNLPSDTNTFYVRTRSISKADSQVTDYPAGALPEVTLETKYNFLVVNDKILQYLICDGGSPLEGAILIAQVTGCSYPISGLSRSSGRAIIYMGDFYSTSNRQTLPLNGGESLTLTWLTGKFGTEQTTQSVPTNTGGSESIAAETREVYISCVDPPEDPHIDSISPNILKSGDLLTINGENFGSTQGASQVLFGTTTANSYLSWTDTRIQVYVPSIYPDTCDCTQVKVSVGSIEGNTIAITIDNEKPAIFIQNPPDGGKICSSLQNVAISGTATDQCASIAKVEVKIDTNPWQTAAGTGTWACALDLGAASLGIHTISARAIDQLNHMSTIVIRSIDIISCDTNIVYVDKTATGSGTGASWEDAFTTIQEGIDWAASQAINEIWVAQGTYNENIVLAEGVSVYGGFNGTETGLDQRDHQSYITTIDGRQQGITVFGTHNALIDGFSITNGNSDWGGGIYCPANADMSLYNNHIHHNKAYVSGGGIYLGNQSNTQIIGNTIQNNEALYGGGIIADTTQSCLIMDNAITDNTAIYKDANQTEGGLGAGIYFNDSNAQVSDNIIQDNVAESEGGGIYIWSGDVSIFNNDICGNKAVRGGGLVDCMSSAIHNNHIHSNQADHGGGAIYIENSAATNVLGNLIENNSADSGGGIFADQDSAPLIESNRMIDNEAGNMSGAGGAGGAINLNSVSSAQIFKNLIQKNSAEWGGGILVWGGSNIKIRNNVINNNTVINNGGAIYFDGGASSLLLNNTFFKNASGGSGSCLSVWDANTTVDVMNSIIEPVTQQSPIILDTIPPSFSVTYTDTYGWDEPGAGNINQDPLLINPDSGNFRLRTESPCIDAGNPDTQYNDIDDSRNDMGAFGGPDPICLECFVALIRATGQKIGNAVRVSQVTIGIDNKAETKSPAPPPPSYTVRIRLMDPNSSETFYGKDIRACGEMEEIWKIKVEINDEVADPIHSGYYPELSWDTHALSIVGTFSLWSGTSDEPTGQLVADMSMIDQYLIKPEDGEYFYILYSNTTTVTMDLTAGWSMISLPVVPQDAALSALFPGAAVLYRFERGSGYVRVKAGENLEVGKGYWILINEDQGFVLNGQPIHSYSKTINSNGWEMIGGCSSGARPTTDYCGIGVIYRYVRGAGYQRVLGSELMEPGGGFWILFNEIENPCEMRVETILF
ncbi:MAG: right-handed parallel beta-helix repeat-containing protein [bacterium]